MTRLLTITIAFALLFQCMAHYFVVALYEWRKDYIATYLCEERDKPESVCCGKCYLKKQIVKIHHSEEEQSGNLAQLVKPELSVFLLPVVPEISSIELRVLGARIPRLRDLSDQSPCLKIFRPPSRLS